jgi:hypothetical protein
MIDEGISEGLIESTIKPTGLIDLSTGVMVTHTLDNTIASYIV